MPNESLENAAIDLTNFQAQFPDEFDRLDFDGYTLTDMAVTEDGVKRIAQLITIPVVDNRRIIGYVGEMEDTPFYSIVEKNQLISTHLGTGHAMRFPIISKKGESVLDLENRTPINFVMADDSISADKNVCEWACAAALTACVAFCTGNIIVAIANEVAPPGVPIVMVGMGTAYLACVATCVNAYEVCMAAC